MGAPGAELLLATVWSRRKFSKILYALVHASPVVDDDVDVVS